jgi:hypothetical protein
MKTLVMSLITLAAAVVFAQAASSLPQPPPIPQPPPHTIWVQATGSSFGMCDGVGNTYFCVDDLKRRAEQDGQMNAQNQCFMQGGQAGFGSCNTFCTPNYIPPGSPSQMVNCHANCNTPCEIRGF